MAAKKLTPQFTERIVEVVGVGLTRPRPRVLGRLYDIDCWLYSIGAGPARLTAGSGKERRAAMRVFGLVR
jgi:hypothetical protein